ncbi:MAG: hypothetical protein ACYTG6_18050, partial [Planctomycetota bacterium]
MSADEDPEDEHDELELGGRTGLTVGVFALIPLLVAYEWARAAVGGGLRNTSELLLTRALAPFSEHESWIRLGVLGVLTAVLFVRLRLREEPVGRTLVRSALEGLAGALLLGPLLVLLVGLVGDSVSAVALPTGPPAAAPGLERVALVFGGSAWEELLFRVGLYSVLYLLVVRCLLFLGAHRRLAHGAADLCGLVGSSFLFAAAHLDGFVGLFGVGG